MPYDQESTRRCAIVSLRRSSPFSSTKSRAGESSEPSAQPDAESSSAVGEGQCYRLLVSVHNSADPAIRQVSEGADQVSSISPVLFRTSASCNSADLQHSCLHRACAMSGTYQPVLARLQYGCSKFAQPVSASSRSGRFDQRTGEIQDGYIGGRRRTVHRTTFHARPAGASLQRLRRPHESPRCRRSP